MIPAFVLRNIAAVNFYLYAQDFPISGRGNAVFLGGNGSGKSVLLDAIQIVMTGMNRRYLDLNSRVSEGGRSTRTVREACLGLLDDGEGYQRDACLTYIALGFEAVDGSRRCTAGVCLEAKASLSEENVLGLFILEGEILGFADFIHPKPKGFEEKAWPTFLDEQRRKGREVKTFQRQKNQAFLRELYAIINANARGTQLDPDRARAALRQALSFDIAQITSVTDFVKRFLLDDLPIEIETFQARYNTWRDMQKTIERVEAEIRTVETIRAACERVMEDQFNTRMWNYGAQRAEYDRYGAFIAKQRQEIAEMQEKLDSTRSYQQTLVEGIEQIRRRLDAIKDQIDGTPAFEQIKKAQAERNTQDAIRKAGVIEAKPIFDALNALREATNSPAFPTGLAKITDFASRLTSDLIGVHDAAWPKSPKQIAALVSAVPQLSDVRAVLDERHQNAASAKASLTKEFDEGDRILKKLRSGGTYMSNDTQDFLADMAKMRVPAQSLSEVADIAPAFAEWRAIIESILGDWADALIIEPRFMDQAYRHFDSHYKATRAKLIQSENVLAQDQSVRSGTLAEAVVTDNSYARAFLNVRLGRIIRARSANDIRKGDLAASADGKYAHGRGIEYRQLKHIPRLGQSVREQQIAQLSEQQRELETKLQTARDNERRSFAVLEAIKRAETTLVTNRGAAAQLLETIESADRESERQVVLIRDLEAELPQGVMQEKREVEQMLVQYRKERDEEREKEDGLIDAIGQRKGAMNTNADERKKAAERACEAFPPFDRRRQRHDPAIGLEAFARRARAAYVQERAARGHPAHVRNHFDGLLKDRASAQRVARLNAAIQDYVQANPDQHPHFEWTQFVATEQTTTLYDWIDSRHRELTQTILRNFKGQIDKAVAALVETMVHDFLSRLSGNIDAVDRIKDDLNRALRGSVFMEEVYQIRQERDQDKETIRYLIDRLDIVAPKATALMQSNPDPNDPDQVKIKELIDMLTIENGDDAQNRRRIRELADYRSYFRFSIDICDPQQGYRRISDLEQRRGKASGGQKFVPFYICLGVAAASAYFNHLGGSREAPPQSALMLMDEAFEKLDPDNIYKIIRFYDQLGLQLIMAAPKTHQALYQETFDTLISIIKVGRAIQVTPQHFHHEAHALLRKENPMHQPRSFFEDRVREERRHAAE
jgi:energy-coupling factor transporter ATP-binding protein EcfA2